MAESAETGVSTTKPESTMPKQPMADAPDPNRTDLIWKRGFIDAQSSHKTKVTQLHAHLGGDTLLAVNPAPIRVINA